MNISNRVRDFVRKLGQGLNIQRLFKRGDKVPDVQTVQQILAAYEPIFRQTVTDTTTRLINNEIKTPQWQREIERALTELYLTAAAGAAGHVGGLDNDMLAEIRRTVKQQSNIYLNRFATQIDQEREKWDADKILNRLNLYVGSAKPIVSRALRMANDGLKGMPAVPAEPGERTICKTNCKCNASRITNLNPEKGTADIWWDLDPTAENCETCIERARLWHPLRIRNWKIVSDITSPRLYAD